MRAIEYRLSSCMLPLRAKVRKLVIANVSAFLEGSSVDGVKVFSWLAFFRGIGLNTSMKPFMTCHDL